jgi:16S rRNA (guanine966-N2)-methyltransferase
MRIIAGSCRGLPLDEPADATRPTSDRVREAIFNVLRNVTPEARVLDLFAGTGALGLEALSRGASSCTFVENDPHALTCLKKNIAKSKLPKTRLISDDALKFTNRELTISHEEFDLIFADPPYFRNGSADLAGALLSQELPLSTNGILVLEVEAERTTPRPEALTLLKRKDYGKTSVLYFENSPSEGSS